MLKVGYSLPFSLLNYELAQLDCLLSFSVAAVSAPIPYVRPKMHPEGTGVLKLTDLRHPCLELQDDVTYIANDVEFKKGKLLLLLILRYFVIIKKQFFVDETQMYIITGPNMGGKSTYIRSVGAAVVMAHIGSFVPCAAAEI